MDGDFSFGFLKSKDSCEIVKMIDQVKKEIFRIKISQKLKQNGEEVFDTSAFSRYRSIIARMSTILSSRKKKKE